MKRFASTPTTPPARANADMVQDFLDLHFQLEGGTPLPVLTRFESPVTLRLTGQAPSVLETDLNALLARLKREAGISITRVGANDAARITVQAVPQAQIQKILPQAACFVVPNVTALSDYRRKRNSPETNWANLRSREQLAIFIPNDVAPQEMRDCLHEELAQALGPLNDLYRLPDSVFNDDNMQPVLTGFDMLMLRATYAPELRTGMSRNAVAQALPAVLARLNPRGARLRPNPLPKTPRSWSAAIEATLTPGAAAQRRSQAARRAAEIARNEGWRDHRLAFSYYLVGGLEQYRNPKLAQAHFQTALEVLNQLPGAYATPLRASTLGRLAAFEVQTGDPASASARVDAALPQAEAAQNAALLSTLLLIKAQAADLTGAPTEALVLRQDSLGWALYGYGPKQTRSRFENAARYRPKPASPQTQIARDHAGRSPLRLQQMDPFR